MYPESRLSHNWLIKHALNRCVTARVTELSGTVLDLGCGTRPFEKEILQHAELYVGVDWSDSLHGFTGDINSDLNKPLPIASESADHVVSFEVLEHLSEPRTMLSEAFRILKSGGQITLSTPFQWWVHEAPWDYFRYTSHGLEHLLTEAGFRNIAVTPTTGFWSMWVLKLNYQTVRLIRGSRIPRILVRIALVPFWWINQYLARWADRHWPEERETAGYFVTAIKP